MVVRSSIYGNVRAGSDCGDGHSAVLNLFFLPRSLEQVRLPLSERVSLRTVLWRREEESGVYTLSLSRMDSATPAGRDEKGSSAHGARFPHSPGAKL